MMAKEKSKEKKDKSSKKEKRSTKDGISKSSSKKEKKERIVIDAQTLASASADAASPPQSASIPLDDTPMSEQQEQGQEPLEISVSTEPMALVPLAALVPFANPLADEKVGKKVLKGVKKAAKQKLLKRGVKEVVKSLRKSALATPQTSSSVLPSGVVVLAADISPMDVISHIPVLCEDHGVPYVYVPSRAELGAAGATKRPTSVVLVTKEGAANAGAKKNKSKKEGEENGENGDVEGKKEKGGEDEWAETYADLVKVVRRAGRDVRI